jgi:hypothetical protein
MTLSSHLKDRWDFWRKARNTESALVLSIELAAGFLCFVALIWFLWQAVNYLVGESFSFDWRVFIYYPYLAVMIALLVVAKIMRIELKKAESEKKRFVRRILFFLFFFLCLLLIIYGLASILYLIVMFYFMDEERVNKYLEFELREPLFKSFVGMIFIRSREANLMYLRLFFDLLFIVAFSLETGLFD